MMNRMTLKSSLLSVVVGFVLLAILFSLGGCNARNIVIPPTGPSPNITSPPVGSSPQGPLAIDLSFPQGAPRLNQTAELKCVVTVHQSSDNMTLKINLPEGLAMVSGDSSWSGSLYPPGSKKEPTQNVKELKAIVKAIKVGGWTIEAVVTTSPGNSWGCVEGGCKYPIYVLISDKSAVWSKHPWWVYKYNPGFKVEIPDPLPGPPLKLDLNIVPPPPLNAKGEIIYTVKPTNEAQPIHLKNVKIELLNNHFSKGLNLLNGNPSWYGDIPKEGMELRWPIQSIALGGWLIQVNINCLGAPYVMKVDGNEYITQPTTFTQASERRELKVNQDSATVTNVNPRPLTPEQKRAMEEYMRTHPPPTPPAVSPSK